MNKNMSIIFRHISDYILDFMAVKCYNENIQEYVIKSIINEGDQFYGYYKKKGRFLSDKSFLRL